MLEGFVDIDGTRTFWFRGECGALGAMHRPGNFSSQEPISIIKPTQASQEKNERTESEDIYFGGSDVCLLLWMATDLRNTMKDSQPLRLGNRDKRSLIAGCHGSGRERDFRSRPLSFSGWWTMGTTPTTPHDDAGEAL